MANSEEKSETGETPAQNRKSRLKKNSGKLLFATSLFATSVLLSACGGRDCVQIYQPVGTPGSSGFTNSSPTQPQSYCYGSGDRYYGTSYVYVGRSFIGGSSGSSS
jgi:hypothetical protein